METTPFPFLEVSHPMITAYVVVTLITVAINAFDAIASFAGAGFVQANSAEVGVPSSTIVPLGVLKAAGAVGLLVGLAGIDAVGVAAAVGLVAFFVCAVVLHMRRKVLHNIAFPATYLAFAVATLVLMLAT